MKQIAIAMKVDLEDVNKKICWPLYQEFEHAFDGLLFLMNDPDKVLKLLKLTKDE